MSNIDYLQELDENGNVKAIEEIKQLKSQIEYWQAQTMENAGFTGEQFRMIQKAIARDIKDKLFSCCRYDLDSEGNCDIVIDEPNFIGIFQDYGVDE